MSFPRNETVVYVLSLSNLTPFFSVRNSWTRKVHCSQREGKTTLGLRACFIPGLIIYPFHRREIVRVFEVSLLKSKTFWLLCLSNFLWSFAVSIIYIHLPSLAASKGQDVFDGVLLICIIGIATFASKAMFQVRTKYLCTQDLFTGSDWANLISNSQKQCVITFAPQTRKSTASSINSLNFLFSLSVSQQNWM